MMSPSLVAAIGPSIEVLQASMANIDDVTDSEAEWAREVINDMFDALNALRVELYNEQYASTTTGAGGADLQKCE